MPTFTYIFDISVDDVIKKKKTITSSQFRTAYNDVFFDWQLSFVTQRRKNLREMEMKLINWSDSYTKCSVSPYVRFELVKKIDDGEVYTQHADCQFGLNCDSESGIVQSQMYPVLTQCNFDGKMPEIVKIYAGNLFKIVCTLSISERYFYHFDKDAAANYFLSESAVLNLFNKITDGSENDFLSDVTLVSSDDVEFRCHRFVLCANSKVFNVMFSNENFQESNSLPRKVKVYDIDGKTLKELLRFMYTKDISFEFNQLAENLLYGSDKYDLKKLKSICEHSLKYRLSPANIFRYFELADDFKLESLMTSCCKLFEVYLHLLDETRLEEFYADFPHLVRENFRLVYKDDKNYVF